MCFISVLNFLMETNYFCNFILKKSVKQIQKDMMSIWRIQDICHIQSAVQFWFKMVRELWLTISYTKSLTVIVSAIAVWVGIRAIVAIGEGGKSVLRSSNRTGQQSQEGSNKNELKQKKPLNPFTKMNNTCRVCNIYRSEFCQILG